MRAWRTGGAAVLCLALAAGVVAGQQPPCRRWGEPDRRGVFEVLFGVKKASKKADGRPPEEKMAEPPKAQAVAPPRAARDPERQLNAYQRRLDVCTRLREVARDTNDQKLDEEAARLEEMAAQVLQQRLAPAEDPAARLEAGAPGAGPDRPGERTASVREGKR
jgi:hypothetical protein